MDASTALSRQRRRVEIEVPSNRTSGAGTRERSPASRSALARPSVADGSAGTAAPGPSAPPPGSGAGGSARGSSVDCQVPITPGISASRAASASAAEANPGSPGTSARVSHPRSGRADQETSHARSTAARDTGNSSAASGLPFSSASATSASCETSLPSSMTARSEAGRSGIPRLPHNLAGVHDRAVRASPRAYSARVRRPSGPTKIRSGVISPLATRAPLVWSELSAGSISRSSQTTAPGSGCCPACSTAPRIVERRSPEGSSETSASCGRGS